MPSGSIYTPFNLIFIAAAQQKKHIFVFYSLCFVADDDQMSVRRTETEFLTSFALFIYLFKKKKNTESRIYFFFFPVLIYVGFFPWRSSFRVPDALRLHRVDLIRRLVLCFLTGMFLHRIIKLDHSRSACTNSAIIVAFAGSERSPSKPHGPVWKRTKHKSASTITSQTLKCLVLFQHVAEGHPQCSKGAVRPAELTVPHW